MKELYPEVETTEEVEETKSNGLFRAIISGVFEGILEGTVITCMITGVVTLVTGAIVLIAAMFAPKQE